MQENDLLDEQDLPVAAPVLPEPKVRMVLMAQIGLMIFYSGVGVLVYFFMCAILGLDNSVALTADSPPPVRWQVRMQLGLAHFFGFLVAGFTTVWVFYRGITQTRMSWPDYLQTRRWPRFTELFLGILLMAVSLPLVLYALNINQQLPLPEFFKMAGEQAEQALKGLLKMDNVAELVINIFIIALLPALGEELVLGA